MQRSVPKLKTTGRLAATVAGLVLALCALPGVSYALGIGTINVKSALNQPLDAEIDLLGITPEDLEGLTAATADQGVYERMGMELTPLIQRLQFHVAEKTGGRYAIQVTSTEPIRDPFLSFLIEVNWRNGRVLREFTLLLDPPSVTDEKPAPVEVTETAPPPGFTVGAAPAEVAVPVAQLETPQEAAAAAPVESVAPVAEVAPEPLAEPVAELAAEAAPSTLTQESIAEPRGVRSSSGQTYGPVKRGSRLWGIAEKTKPQGISVEQMMFAYLRENPKAFFGNNVSMLKAGSILRVPEGDQLTELDTSAAVAEMIKHHSRWLDYVRKHQSQTSPVAAASLKKRVGEKSKKKAAPKGSDTEPAVAAAKGKALLELVTPSDAERLKPKAGVAGETGHQLDQAKNELALSAEAVEAARKENTELKGRLSSLEDQMSSMQNLLVLKDQEMQTLQGVPPTHEAGAPMDQVPGVQVDLPSGTAHPAAPIDEAAKPAVKPAAGMLSDRLTVATIVGGVLLVLLVAGLVVRSRRRTAKAATEAFDSPNFEDEYGDRIEDGVEIVEPNGSSFTLRSRSRGPDLAPLTNVNQPSGASILAMEPGEIDPVSEAEVYLAYGKHDKAEEVVRASIKREPENAELRLKLLEILYQRRDQQRFIESAEEVYAALGDVDQVWGKVAKWGQDLCPGNPLFSPVRSRPSRAAESLSLVDIDAESPFPADAESPKAPGKDTIWQADRVGRAAQISIDPLSVTVAEQSQFTANPRSDIRNKFAETQATAAETDLKKAEEEALEELAASFVEERQNVRRIDEGAQSLAVNSTPKKNNSESPRSEYFLLANQVDTKLDLAKAYLDMGDKEGSLELLMEVVEEGDSRQKDEAKRLLSAVA